MPLDCICGAKHFEHLDDVPLKEHHETCPRAKKCGCGKPATHECWEIWPPGTLIACHGPICDLSGCPGHRHQPGSMGYPGQLKGSTRWLRYEPDSDGFWHRLVALYRTFFWSAQRKANDAWRLQLAAFPPPAPYPFLQLLVGDRMFESRGERIIEVDQWSEKPRFEPEH